MDNRLSSIDLAAPGGRFVIASDDDGGFAPEANDLLPLSRFPTCRRPRPVGAAVCSIPARCGWRHGSAFAWALDDARAVVRGGYGIFLNQWAYSVQTAFARNLPFFFTKQVDVPADVRAPSLATRDILTSDATGTVGGSIMDYAYSVEYSQTWSAGLQYALWPTTMAEISYMGTWTLGADNATVRNVPEPGPGSIQARRAIPQLSRINAIRFDGKSIYHGFTVKIDRRLTSGVAFTTSYTLSTSKDDASSPGSTESEANVPQDVRNVFDETGEWAASSFDHRHQFIASGSVDLPSLARQGAFVRAVLGGWRANAIVIVQSGAPFTVNLAVDRANVGAGPAQRPDALGDPNLPDGERTPERWFDTGAFALPAAFTFGSARRNSVLGPGYATVDTALAKTWTLRGASTLELRWEVFNLLDRANFDLPNRVFGTPNFGRIFSARNPREMQFGARLTF